MSVRFWEEIQAVLREERVSRRGKSVTDSPHGGGAQGGSAIDRAGQEAPWYADGLNFTCTQCGRCCGGAPGYVWVTPAETEAIAKRLAMPVADFEKRHVRNVGVRRSLRELRNGDCEFLLRRPDRTAYCSIYEDRPRQCRTWPFWAENLESRGTWDATAQGCPGMNKGQHHALPVIQAALTGR